MQIAFSSRMMKRGCPGAVGFAFVLLLIGAAYAAVAGDPPAPSCDGGAEAYDRKADEYEAAATRYRAWAAAERMFATDPYGNEWELTRRAERLAAAALRSRSHAAESRREAAAPTGAASDGCSAATIPDPS